VNYRHAYHAGNFADVMKHALLARVIHGLKAKDAAFRVMDTHAGLGLYDLTATEAGATGEAKRGIGRYLAAAKPPKLAEILAPYDHALKAVNAADGTRYPGSPMIAATLTRAQDRISLAEMHPDDSRTLAKRFDHDRRVIVQAMNGWTALKAWTPPPERRGLVLIDPPFEKTDEFATMTEALEGAYRKWATGMFLLWYPLKKMGDVGRFTRAITALALPKTLRLELSVAPEGETFAGSGLIIVNPPWTLKAEAEILLPWLLKTLSDDPKQARWRSEWLVGEKSGD
jgi:23S rRNA (adenine2030-N6)-methyltransferase